MTLLLGSRDRLRKSDAVLTLIAVVAFSASAELEFFSSRLGSCLAAIPTLRKLALDVFSTGATFPRFFDALDGS